MQAQFNNDNSNLPVVERVRRGNYKGLNFVGLARLSFEIDPDRDYSSVPVTGLDFSNREEQERVEREYVENRGGTYLGTVHEADTSAWKKKRVKQADGTTSYRVVRPKYERILKNLKLGVLGDTAQDLNADLPESTPVHGLVVSVDDRLTRNNRHLEDAIEVVEHFDKVILDVSGTLDLLTENGRDMARVMVTMNGKQSAATSRRLRDNHYARAIRGIPSGGHRPFGWEDDKRTIRESEAKHIRKAAKDLLAGVLGGTIVSKWNRDGVLTSRGVKWRRRSFSYMMTNPRLAGIRTYGKRDKPLHQRYMLDQNKNPIMGNWNPILDFSTWLAVVEILTGPDRKGAHEYIGKLKYSCSGLVFCGLCGTKCNAHANHQYYYFSCKPVADGGCAKISGSGNAIERIVKNMVLEYLSSKHVAVEVGPWAKADELEKAKSAKKSLLEQFKENSDMGPYIWPQMRELDKQIADLVKDRNAHLRKMNKPREATVVERWDSLEVEQQRAIIGECIEAIVLMPAKKKSNRFDPDRLKIIWRQE